ncbi:hypothetical protein ABPG72_016349 [Tetrahymena utriculariae]
MFRSYEQLSQQQSKKQENRPSISKQHNNTILQPYGIQVIAAKIKISIKDLNEKFKFTNGLAKQSLILISQLQSVSDIPLRLINEIIFKQRPVLRILWIKALNESQNMAVGSPQLMNIYGNQMMQLIYKLIDYQITQQDCNSQKNIRDRIVFQVTKSQNDTRKVNQIPLKSYHQ